MSKPFLLILSASGGSGHIRAGDALLQAAHRHRASLRAEHFDCLDFTTPLFKRLYAGTYHQMINHMPEVWGYFYERTEATTRVKKGMLQLFDRFNYQRYLHEVLRRKPDALVCTHFVAYRSISEELRRRKIPIPVFAVTTDFDAHQYWVDPVVSRYYVHTAESAWQLHSKNVPADLIRVTGIPVGPAFAKPLTQKKARQQARIPGDRFTVLIVAGGAGVGRVEEVVAHVASVLQHTSRRSFTLAVVCGTNQGLKSRLEKFPFAANIQPRILGFLNNIDVWMGAADVLISKAGGLTSAEAMARSLPMIVVNPIPGQETRNADIIVEHGAGWKALNFGNLMYKLVRVLDQPETLRRARQATRALGQPAAASTIIGDVMKHLKRHPREKT